MSDFDVIIIGGGIAGASLGAELARKVRVLLIEAEEHCGFHSTGRSAAFWLESYGGAEVALLTAASKPFLEAPPADFDESGFLSARGALHVSRTGWAQLPESVASRRVGRIELEALVPGIRREWRNAVLEPGCADIDVAALHQAYLRALKNRGGVVRLDARLASAGRSSGAWTVELGNSERITGAILVNAAGAWADEVAMRSAVAPLRIAPKRRTMVQLRVGRSGIRRLPQVIDAGGTFYFKGETDRSIWLSPHDEIETGPCDAAPEEIDVATAIDRFEQVVDWPVEAVERRWAGLRSFAPDRLPVIGFDAGQPGFFWCAGQGGFGIQTAPAASRLGAALLLGEPLPKDLEHIDPSLFAATRFG